MYSFIHHYVNGQDYKGNRRFWGVYNKATKTFTHYLTSDTRDFLENDLDPVGMPFWTQGTNHRDEMYRIFTKKAIKDLIDAGEYNNTKLQATYDNIPDNGILIMTVR